MGHIRNMQIALAAAGFYDRNIEYNKNKIISILQQMRGKADRKYLPEMKTY